MTTSPTTALDRLRRLTVGGAPVAALVLLLAACGDEAPSADTAARTATAAPEQVREAPGFDGVVGRVAAVTGTTMQVQDTDSQTAVTWTDATTFRRTVAGTAADVVPGVCVAAFSVPSQDGTAGAASSVAVSDPVDGTCEAGPGGQGGFPGGAPGDLPDDVPTDLPRPGERPEGAPTDLPDLPEGAPTDLPEPGDGGFPGAFGATSGLVTAVDGATLTVQVTSSDGAVSTGTVTVDDATVYTRTVTGDASAVEVGLCAVALGDTDDSGAVTATTVTLSDAGDDGCTSGGPGRGGPGGPGGPGLPGDRPAQGDGRDDDA